MRVFVACQTAGVIECKSDKLSSAFQDRLLMAGDAGYRQMASGKRVIRLAVQLDCEFGRRETLDRVTFLACPPALSSGELSVVVVAVAVYAEIEFHLLERFSRLVAFIANDCCVFTEQREFRFGVVEFCSVDTLPAGRVMASLAILAEFVAMGIFVTIQAFPECQPFKLHKFLIILEFVVYNRPMAFIAGQT
jgi:hypothetical protein